MLYYYDYCYHANCHFVIMLCIMLVVAAVAYAACGAQHITTLYGKFSSTDITF